MKKWLIGIDEAGRGPLAGPVAVGLAKVPAGFDWRQLPGVTDSKKLTEAKREIIYKEAVRLRREGKLDFKVLMPGAGVIDKQGISKVIRTAIKTGLKRLKSSPANTEARLDGSLKAPVEFTHQKTIIKGDQKEKVIGLASIVAKVTRDRYMVRKAALPPFAPYNFEQHKGYGTKAHITVIRKHGLSELHRQTYCTRLCQ